MTDPIARQRIRDIMNFYAGPLHQGADVPLRRRRLARLLRGCRRKGWKPKMGLYKARRYGTGFRKAFTERLTTAVVQAIRESA